MGRKGVLYMGLNRASLRTSAFQLPFYPRSTMPDTLCIHAPTKGYSSGSTVAMHTLRHCVTIT